MFNRARRSGFTLPEVLVTVAIVAVLAAIVVPTVTNQIGKGDETSIATNVQTLRTGTTAFVSDVRKFPNRIQYLLTAPATTDSTIPAGTFGGAAGRWGGPYLSGSLKARTAGASADSLQWGGLAYARDILVDSAFGASSGYVVVTLTGISSAAIAAQIDTLIDGATGQNSGSLRWNTTQLSDSGHIKLLLMGR